MVDRKTSEEVAVKHPGGRCVLIQLEGFEFGGHDWLAVNADWVEMRLAGSLRHLKVDPCHNRIGKAVQELANLMVQDWSIVR